jgi:thymidylate kinase
VSWPTHLVKPTITFYLSLDNAARVARIASREKNEAVVETPEEKQLREDPDFCDRIKAQYLRVETVNHVNVTGLSPQDVVEKLLSLLKDN